MKRKITILCALLLIAMAAGGCRSQEQPEAQQEVAEPTVSHTPETEMEPDSEAGTEEEVLNCMALTIRNGSTGSEQHIEKIWSSDPLIKALKQLEVLEEKPGSQEDYSYSLQFSAEDGTEKLLFLREDSIEADGVVYQVKSTDEVFAQVWTLVLLEEDTLTEDFNGDGSQETISVSYVEMEGSMYIKEFQLTSESSVDTFVKQDYIASIDKIGAFDFDNDGKKELLVQFNSHGAGGQGTYDVFVVWLDGQVTARQMESPIPELRQDGSVQKEVSIPGIDSDGIELNDGIYAVEQVTYKGQERMAVRQYTSGDGGHVDGMGDLVSIVEYDRETGTFKAIDTWFENEEESMPHWRE